MPPNIFSEDPYNNPEYRAKFKAKNGNYEWSERRNEGRLKIEFRSRQRRCKHKKTKWLSGGYNYGSWDRYLCLSCGYIVFDKIEKDDGFRIND